MTVQELIVELNKMPPNMKVLVGANRLCIVRDSVRLTQTTVVSDWGWDEPWWTTSLPDETSCVEGQVYVKVVNIHS